MSKFPETIKIKIVDAITKQPIESIAVYLRLFANHKNDYFMAPIRSDFNGEINICKEWVKKEIEETRNLFIMDYCSTLDDCKPFFDIGILDSDAIERSIDSMKQWQSILNTPQEEIDNLRMARNSLYKPVSKIVNLNDSNELEVVLETEQIRAISI